MKRLLKWLPAIVAPVVVAGVVAAPAFATTASPGRAESVATATKTPTPAQALALIAKAKGAHYSGTVRQTSDLGLPDLSSALGELGASGSQSSDILDLLTASHTAKIYVDGSTKQRVQVLDSLVERDVVRNGRTVWTWDSKANAAVKVTLPSKTARNDATPSATPQDLATKLVAQAKKSSTLTVSKGSTAGRSVWRVTLAPKASQAADTLVAKVVLSVDAKTGVPLAVQVDAAGQKSPAVTVGFSSVDFSTPAASNFTFTPPKGAKVTTKKLSASSHTASPDNRRPGSFEGPTVTGTGWTSIVAVPAGSLGAGTAGLTAAESHTLNELTQSVDGGRGLQTSLFSVFLTDDGSIYAGAVPLSTLESAAK
ncbi:hypothetical protein [Humibacter sp. RRB41]|uniref:LolA family protein n=1 Tax=Humibacter sp. RRB41 TaxID=2919946 RepID=UPI001FAA714A|nr:hypothetical protein [Humibacter sp. RRB41]